MTVSEFSKRSGAMTFSNYTWNCCYHLMLVEVGYAKDDFQSVGETNKLCNKECLKSMLAM